ncbi:hypothetical protein I3843_02G011600 [Carya illinoinensis]|nr:hypothetical protein I3843_02G011600 [Carya illinoinensis]
MTCRNIGSLILAVDSKVFVKSQPSSELIPSKKSARLSFHASWSPARLRFLIIPLQISSSTLPLPSIMFSNSARSPREPHVDGRFKTVNRLTLLKFWRGVRPEPKFQVRCLRVNDFTGRLAGPREGAGSVGVGLRR